MDMPTPPRLRSFGPDHQAYEVKFSGWTFVACSCGFEATKFDREEVLVLFQQHLLKPTNTEKKKDVRLRQDHRTRV